MLFNSLSYLVFFPVVLLLHFLLPHKFRWAMLLAASCLFYMAFIPVYILILLATIIVDYFAGIWIDSATGGRRKAFLVLSLIANCGILFFFKYYNFFSDNLKPFIEMSRLNIILPIGLSFHTFQAMSYTIEVYRGNQKPERHFGIYALYVMFFPQLVAGPIERPQNLLHQFHEKKAFDASEAVLGLRQILLGMFKKVVIADQIAIAVNLVYDKPGQYSGIALVVATVFFAFQIYCDFSGYSDIALGSARMLGFKLMTNFNFPYKSLTVSEFWKRWHVSLSTWFKDYLYIPLGGNRTGPIRWAFNTLLVFLVSGFWHGANWTYVAWGGLNGIYLIIERMLGVSSKASGTVSAVLKTLVTFTLICFTWIFFRARTMSDALYILKNMWVLSADAAAAIPSGTLYSGLAAILALEIIQYIQRNQPKLARSVLEVRWSRWALYYAAVALIYVFAQNTEQQFIYFQF